MKVRGARRKRQRMMYLFQRLGDVGQASVAAMIGFGTALINVQNAINRMYEKHAEIERITAESVDGLGASITKGDHASN